MTVLRQLVAAAPEPRAELLALVWGPRFDREHALSLLAGGGHAHAFALPLARLADRYDRLPRDGQQRLRQAVLGAGAMVEQSLHAPHPAD